jgi:Domain of unknown function (DUF4331)
MRKIPILAALVLGAALIHPPTASASSHREAPFVTKNPKVDGTDFYLFNSYESGRTGFVTMIANYQPFQDAWGGPNYFTMDDQALYEIMIDNNGDAKEDITFQFQFTNTLANGGTGITLNVGDAGQVAIPLIAAGPITGADGGTAGATQNVIETFTVNMVAGDRRTGTVTSVTNHNGGGKTFAKPLDNIGNKTFADYAGYANAFIYDIDFTGCTGMGAKMFVGQRAEPFAVNIGPVFDLVNASGAILNSADRGAIANPLSCKNITSIAIEVPAACLNVATTGASKDVIAGWTTASVPQARVINPSATYTEPTKEGGPWAQVSRLGMPLVNEIVVGLPDKDGYNASAPSTDAKNTAFVQYAEYPTLPTLLGILFASAGVVTPQAFPRVDLVTAFATGVPGVNANGATAEYTRLNTAVPATPATSQNNLGAAGCFATSTAAACSTTGTPYACDCAGFPNGRRPGDDVVDIELNVAMGFLLPFATAGATANPNAALFFNDAVLQDPSQFGITFPYLTTPTGGATQNTVQACAGPQGIGSF